MPKTCFVPNCRSGYKRRKLKNDPPDPPEFPDTPQNFSTFKAQTQEKLNEWQKAIPRKDKILTFKDHVCEKHFQPHEIIRCFEQKMPDGKIFRLERDKPKLHPDAVPSIFPDCPSYLSKNIRKRKSPKKRSFSVHRDQKPDQQSAAANNSTRTKRSIDVQEDLDEEMNQTSSDDQNSSLSNYETPPGWLRVETKESVVFMKWTNGKIERHFEIDKHQKMTFHLNNKMIRIKLQEIECTSTAVLSKVFEEFSKIKPCPSNAEKDSACLGFLNNYESGACLLCYSCRIGQKKIKKVVDSNLGRRKVIYNVVRKFSRSKQKVNFLKSLLMIANKCARTKMKKVEDIEKLSPVQKEMVTSCIKMAKCKSLKGMRYTNRWIYECCLMRIKGPSLYESLRRKGIMSLPSPSTLYRYMKRLQPVYGFNKTVFDLMKEKFQTFSNLQRRGVLLFDEMKIVSNVTLDKNTMKLNGLVDLGDYTPEAQKNMPGDHALVFMIQPFVGDWVQPIGAFLSKGAATGRVLSHLIIEAITLVENSGFHIDGIVSDAATWNRAVWKIFEIDSERTFCPHFMDDDRKLFVFSDFPHLIKNLRNWVQKAKIFSTPDGVVKTSDWEKLRVYDEAVHGKYGTKFCPKLSENHLHPKHYAKMNVALAYQFFGIEVAAAMRRVAEFTDSPFDASVSGSYNLIYKVNSLIRAMSSRCPKGALYDEKSQEYKDIQKFITFLEQWRADNQKRIKLMDTIISPSDPVMSLSSNSESTEDFKEEEYELPDEFYTDAYAPYSECYDYDDEENNDQSDDENDDQSDDENDDQSDDENDDQSDDEYDEENWTSDDDSDCEELQCDRPDDEIDDKCTEKEKKQKLKQAAKEKEQKLKQAAKEKKQKLKQAAKEEAQLKKKAKNDIRKQFMTENTFLGLLVSLKNILALHNYLKENYGFHYFMTSRVNQDRLEAFFGMIRCHGGSGAHPTATMFIQIYRLLCVYALIRAPKGSNVNPDTAETLLHIKNSKKERQQKANENAESEWQKSLDALLDKGVLVSEVDDAAIFENLSEALVYFSGYVARKSKKFTSCEACQKTLVDDSPCVQSSYQAYRDFTDGRGLYQSSKTLNSLTSCVEKAIIEETRSLNSSSISPNLVCNIVSRMVTNGNVPLVGCINDSHHSALTKKVISFLIVTRTHFICKGINKEIKNEHRVKGLSKASKY